MEKSNRPQKSDSMLKVHRKTKPEAEKGVKNWKRFQELAERISDINRMIPKLKKREWKGNFSFVHF